MIKIVTANEAEKLTEVDVVGKFVLPDGQTHYPSLGRPRIVSALSKSRVFLVEADRQWSEEERIFLVKSSDTGAVDGYILKKSIRCICDTPDEVNIVLRQEKQLEIDVHEFKEAMQQKINDLNGKTA